MSERLEKLVEDLKRRLDVDPAAEVIGDLVAREGARARFIGGTYELRLSGVAGTCTAGGSGLLQSWCRNAERRIERGRA
ncbi:hypothetical protein C8N35_102108 [Breoghania corrubedonensis]|uniref:Uncharacterized protein n=1 Tax=Breoghania corrubedonensis TaxID=665038 RepID=A0A2T5VCB1_9HYPH|nr:hypothetical protein [Breoghania corrubedonensis]PTW61399.1 hypothetical protein C8N35_102108 [Breoghania corrubedonensis]